MFNKQPFNRGKFNISTGENSANGIALMIMSVNKVSASRIISAIGKSDLSLKNIANGTILKIGAGTSKLALINQGIGTKNYIVSGNLANMIVDYKADPSVTGEQTIKLNLSLKPGEELSINTCDMTVTINGQNAMKYLSSDSEFITLINGINKIIYDDMSADRKLSFDIIWKDRWL